MEAPFFNDTTRIWKSSPHFVYPYRFSFGPHPEHAELCEYDASITLSEFYRLIEARTLRSISTLEREVRGAAHAVKKISLADAKEITKSLYGAFHLRAQDRPVEFRPVNIKPRQPLSQHIRKVGRIEFAVKAVVAHRLAQRDPELIRLIPACEEGYEFLIETFVGQTVRRPTDIFIQCNRGGKTSVTILEAKVDLAKMPDLAQALKYQEIFKQRNIDRGSLGYAMSTCLLAKRFQQDLISYSFVRNMVLPHEEVILLKYAPTRDGTDAQFMIQELESHVGSVTNNYITIASREPLLEISSDPDKLCSIFTDKRFPSRTRLESRLREDNTVSLRRFYVNKDEPKCLTHILIHDVHGSCDVPSLQKFMSLVRKEAVEFQGRFMAVEPILLASDYNDEVRMFIQHYNDYETEAGHHPISAYIRPMVKPPV